MYEVTDAMCQGNEHVTYSSPEGERYTINGVDQPSNNALPAAPSAPTALPSASRSRATNMDTRQQPIATSSEYQQPPTNLPYQQPSSNTTYQQSPPTNAYYQQPTSVPLRPSYDRKCT